MIWASPRFGRPHSQNPSEGHPLLTLAIWVRVRVGLQGMPKTVGCPYHSLQWAHRPSSLFKRSFKSLYWISPSLEMVLPLKGVFPVFRNQWISFNRKGSQSINGADGIIQNVRFCLTSLPPSEPTRTSTHLTELKTYTEFHWQDVQDGKYNSAFQTTPIKSFNDRKR